MTSSEILKWLKALKAIDDNHSRVSFLDLVKIFGKSFWDYDLFNINDLGEMLGENNAEYYDDCITIPLNGSLDIEEIERNLVDYALNKFNMVQKDAAKYLKLTPRALNYRIKNFGIKHESWNKNK